MLIEQWRREQHHPTPQLAPLPTTGPRSATARSLLLETLYIEPGSPWENGYNESFNGTLGEEVLKREIFYSLEEAKVLIEQWRREYNTIRFFLNLPKLNGPHPRLQEAVGLTQ